MDAEKALRQLLLLSALLLSAALASEAARPPADAAAVRDITGRPLLRGAEYSILPVYRGGGGGGGGLTLAGRNRSSPCPMNVAQEGSEVAGGLPVTFLPVNPRDKVVRLSTDANFEFAAATVCVQPTVWRLGELDEATGRRYVTTGGAAGNPGLGTVGNWFKIEKAGMDYKLVFCPGVCKFCKVVCGDLGIFDEKGERWLGLSDVPFPVMFRREA